MINTYDIAYGLAVGVSAPFWLIKPSSRRKVLSAFSQRMGDVPMRDPSPLRWAAYSRMRSKLEPFRCALMIAVTGPGLGCFVSSVVVKKPAIPAHGLLSSTRDGNGTNCSDFIPHFGLMRIEL